MGIKLTTLEKSQSWCCSCPLPESMSRKTFPKKTIFIEFLTFAIVLLIIWFMSPIAFLVVFGIYFASSCINVLYRLMRGHTLGCAIKWSPFIAQYVFGGGLEFEDKKRFK